MQATRRVSLPLWETRGSKRLMEAPELLSKRWARLILHVLMTMKILGDFRHGLLFPYSRRNPCALLVNNVMLQLKFGTHLWFRSW